MARGAGAGGRWIHHSITAEEAGRTVQEILTGVLGVSRRMIQRLTRSGGIRVNGRAPHLSRTLREGDRVALRIAAEEEPGISGVAMELNIVHEDTDLLVLDKPPFLLVHPISNSGAPTLAHGVAHHFRKTGVAARVRPLHRLDRDTSGLVVIAKSAFAHQHLDRQLRAGTLRREYLAIVEGAVQRESGVISAPIGIRSGQPHLRRVDEAGEEAITRFRLIGSTPSMSMIEVELETGRTHQIRVHLSHLGHPLLGDRQYGASSGARLRRQALHAHRIQLIHPVSGDAHTFEAPLPPDLASVAAEIETADESRAEP